MKLRFLVFSISIYSSLLCASNIVLSSWDCSIKIPKSMTHKFKFDVEKSCFSGGCSLNIKPENEAFIFYRLHQAGGHYSIGEYDFMVRPYIAFHRKHDCINDPKKCNVRRSKYWAHGEQQNLKIGILKKNSNGLSDKNMYYPEISFLTKSYSLDYLDTIANFSFKNQTNAGEIEVSCSLI